jgi:hypothetical protein
LPVTKVLGSVPVELDYSITPGDWDKPLNGVLFGLWPHTTPSPQTNKPDLTPMLPVLLLDELPDCTLRAASDPQLCYKRTGQGSFQQAIDECDVLGGYLPRILSQADWNELTTLESGQTWVGLTTDSNP